MAYTQLTGSDGIAGKWNTKVLPLVADTYYKGMPLGYFIAPTAAAGGTNTGDGTCTAITATEEVPVGAYTITFTAALVAKIDDPDGKELRNDLTVPNGGAEAFNVDGLCFTLTDGATAWIAGDTFTITVGTAGAYAYTTEKPQVIYWADTAKSFG